VGRPEEGMARAIEGEEGIPMLKAHSPVAVARVIRTIAILIGLSIFEDGCRWPRVVVDLAIEEYWRGLSKLLEEE